MHRSMPGQTGQRQQQDQQQSHQAVTRHHSIHCVFPVASHVRLLSPDQQTTDNNGLFLAWSLAGAGFHINTIPVSATAASHVQHQGYDIEHCW
ncbi:hypothetical protein [Halomonas cupida]|uniref:hypothetical protein n=1 Tax=Halomonas cupida TaxID=44933 RepID=UPI0013566FCF|nr:hypothetical protein [Halomonas cupida]